MQPRALLVATLALFVTGSVPAQQVAVMDRPIRYVVLDDTVHEWLAKDWDAHEHDAFPYLERGRCLQWRYVLFAGEVAYRVTGIALPDSVRVAMPGHVEFLCAGVGIPLAPMHTHLPQTCVTMRGPCWKGGHYAYFCTPSDEDREGLRLARMPFGLVQCARDASVGYFPEPR